LTEKWKPYSSIVSLYLWEITIQNFFKISAKKLFYDYLEDEKSKICYYDSPIGLLEISTSSKGLKSLSFVDKRQWDECEQPSPLIKSIKKQLSEYFNGTRYTFDIPINYHGTSFQKQVWQSLNLISYGETKNYGEVAKIVGSPKASRAVGGANNKNKIAIIVPCHRVIGANGNLTGYIGGLYKKKWLIQHENKNRLD